MSHHSSATSEELSVEGASALLRSLALLKQVTAPYNQIALFHQQAIDCPKLPAIDSLKLPSPLLLSASKDTQSTRVQRAGRKTPERFRHGEHPNKASEETNPEKKSKQRKRPSSEALESTRAHAVLGSQEAEPKKEAKASRYVILNRDVDYNKKMRARVFAILWSIESPDVNFLYMLKDLEVQMCFRQR